MVMMELKRKKALYASFKISSDVLSQWNLYFYMEYNWESLPIFLPVVLYCMVLMPIFVSFFSEIIRT